MSALLPSHLRGPERLDETKEARFARRLAVAALLRRRRREAGLTHRAIALATYMDGSRISRYEMAGQYPSTAKAEFILEAIARLEKEGAGSVTRAAEAKAEYAAADEEEKAAAGTGQ